MVKSAADRQGSSVAPFLKKLYDMVDDDSTNSIISWTSSNDSFTILDITQFSLHLLPKYFKHSNFSSFMRQLNIYVSFLFLHFFLLTSIFVFVSCFLFVSVFALVGFFPFFRKNGILFKKTIRLVHHQVNRFFCG